MQSTIAVISICSTFFLYGAETTGLSGEDLLQRGVASYRAAKFVEAVTDLSGAAKVFLAPEQMQKYVNTGRFEDLERLETALVYLALAQWRLGKEDEAREAVLRLVTAERIQPTYARLPLGSEAAEFEALAARLVPASAITPNLQLAGGTAPVRVAPPPAPAPAPAPPVAIVQTTPQPPPPQSVVVQQVPDCTPLIEERLAQERSRIEKAIEERIALIERAAEERIAAERAKIQQAADERIAAERAAATKAAEERLAIERLNIQRAAEERMAATQAQARREYLENLRRAETLATSGRLQEASEVYNRIVHSADVPRDILAEAAAGLYRTSAYDRAVLAFQKLGMFRRGEEDLRYYNAVALYETGRFDDAKKELICALPFIQVTDDVARYRWKIERMSSEQALR